MFEVLYSAFGGRAGSSAADGGNKLPSRDFGNSNVSVSVSTENKYNPGEIS